MSTLKDIAARVGVSQGCVSRVLKGDPTFSIQEATRFKILEAAREMGYRSQFSGVRRSGLTKDTLVLLLLYPEQAEIEDPYYHTVRIGVTSEAGGKGYSVWEIFYTPDLELDFSQKNIKGFIVVGSTSEWSRCDELRRQLLTGGLPIVFADFDPGEPGCDSVVTDFHLAMEKALQHFLALGYREIGYIGGQEYREGSKPIVDLRVQYFQDILTRAGCYRKEHVFIANTVSMQVGYTLACQAAQQGLPRALFVETDTMAIGVLKALKERGVQVPGQTGLHPRQRIVIGDGAPIHPHPLGGGQHLPADQLGVRLAETETLREQTVAETHQHLSHVKYDVSDHSCSPGSSTALSPLRRNTPVRRFRNFLRRALASSRSPRSRPPTP